LALPPDRETIRSKLEEYARRVAEELGIAVEEARALILRLFLPRAVKRLEVPSYEEVKEAVGNLIEKIKAGLKAS